MPGYNRGTVYKLSISVRITQPIIAKLSDPALPELRVELLHSSISSIRTFDIYLTAIVSRSDERQDAQERAP